MMHPARYLAAFAALLVALALTGTVSSQDSGPDPTKKKDGENSTDPKKGTDPPAEKIGPKPREEQLAILLERMNAAITRLGTIEEKLSRFEERIKGFETAIEQKKISDQLATMQQDILSIKTQINQIQIDMATSPPGGSPSTSRRMPTGPGAPGAPGAPVVPPPPGSGKGTVSVRNRAPYQITVYINEQAFTVNADETRYIQVNAGDFSYQVPSANQTQPILRRVEANKTFALVVNPN